ncbi:hypothetical protein M407DRAFT_191180 [Tulasnella calospora MUT 4182]|uniref:Uncharacterized protein n=1 Tax=Tulasnella calospora MUT 4182 TaxID=1051891 RepID=A0A0C3QLD7_9AGAM|nr:hypothetical protein M407DRAFT_191180 [Tulasnella calospora MUT 4182]
MSVCPAGREAEARFPLEERAPADVPRTDKSPFIRETKVMGPVQKNRFSVLCLHPPSEIRSMALPKTCGGGNVNGR